ncbi:MAG: TIR domain-containing protein [Candidatus Didemnitutus sp.]|nr:TIR domain-containing protein [Candidatus Didemnitutus sp.]
MNDSAPAIFLSYAHEDVAAARRIADALRSAGIEVWFDENELRGGDSWDAKIRQQIDTCALFIPIISASTQERSKGYFRLEWKLAVDQTHLLAAGVPFIAPVVIDATTEASAIVPPEFMRVQWTRLTDALPTPNFVAQIKKLLGGEKTVGTASRRDPTEPSRHKAAPTTRPSWLVPLAAVVLAVAGYFVWQGTRPVTPATAASSATNIPARPELIERAASSDKSIAVLAFADLSEARNSEYFSDGISEELLNVLAKVPGLKVSARTSAFFFKGKNVPIPEIGEKLNVAYIVEGSVQRAGDRVKITAQLIKAADGFHVWSDTFTRDAKDVFAVQEEIAGRIAKELSLKLGVSSAAATAKINPQAFELYLQGRQAWNLRNEAGYARAEALLNRALELEPNFARAISALADVWLIRGTETIGLSAFGQRDSTALKQIRSQIERALALDPSSAEAYASLGNALQYNWRLSEATRALRQAVALNPNYASGHQWLGRVLLCDGYYDEGLAALRRAAELDPLSPRILDNYAIGLRLFGRYEEALAADERALALQPGSRQAGVWRAVELSGLGRHEEAIAQARLMTGEVEDYERFLIGVLAAGGARAEAEVLLRKIPASEKGRIFRSLVALGRPQEALEFVDAASLRISDMGDFHTDPNLDPIRSDPRFVQLLATLDMTEAHARGQAWRAAQELKKGGANR